MNIVHTVNIVTVRVVHPVVLCNAQAILLISYVTRCHVLVHVCALFRCVSNAYHVDHVKEQSSLTNMDAFVAISLYEPAGESQIVPPPVRMHSKAVVSIVVIVTTKLNDCQIWRSRHLSDS